ncbi:unnamed protein product, partial [Didymodactylos carnosus]
MRCAIDYDKYNGIEIKRGTNIIINLVDLHRRTDAYHSPNEFNLKNVQDKELSNTGENINNFIPFGAGPKECIGRWLAKTEMEVIIEILIKQFRFKRAEGTKPLKELETRWDIAQQPTSPGILIVQKRC